MAPWRPLCCRGQRHQLACDAVEPRGGRRSSDIASLPRYILPLNERGEEKHRARTFRDVFSNVGTFASIVKSVCGLPNSIGLENIYTP